MGVLITDPEPWIKPVVLDVKPSFDVLIQPESVMPQGCGPIWIPAHEAPYVHVPCLGPRPKAKVEDGWFPLSVLDYMPFQPYTRITIEDARQPLLPALREYELEWVEDTPEAVAEAIARSVTD